MQWSTILARQNVELSQVAPRQDSAIKASIEFEHLLGLYPRFGFKVRFWDGTSWSHAQEDSGFPLKYRKQLDR
jgi:hypothetical protein